MLKEKRESEETRKQQEPQRKPAAPYLIGGYRVGVSERVNIS
jgi:hypothetical protein